MRRCRRPFLLVLVLGLLAAPTASADPPAVGLSLSSGFTAVAGHPCDPKNFTLECLANAPGQILTPPAGTNPKLSLFGLDFSWSQPSGSYARSRGAHFGIGYLSGTSKDWRRSILESYFGAGLDASFVYETSAGRSLAGCSAGSGDAWRARWLLQNVYHRWPATTFFASDFDTSGYSTYGSVGAYYHCAASVLGQYSGAYGGLRTMQIARANGIPRLWQTIAWSYGVWDRAACVRQYAIDRPWFGYRVDYDVAVCPNWGQYNYRPPGPSKQEIASWTRARDSSVRAFRSRKCARNVNHIGCFTFQERVTTFQAKLNAVQARPRCYGRQANRSAPVCQVVVPYVEQWARARNSTRNAIRRHRCPANAQRGPCHDLEARLQWYQDKINRNYY